MLTDREKFIYYSTAIAVNPKCVNMPHDKRTILLATIVKEHCKTLRNVEWREIFEACDMLKQHLIYNALDHYSSDKIANMFADFITKGYIEVKTL